MKPFWRTVFFGAVLALATGSGAEAQSKLSIGYTPSINVVPLFIAQDHGIFRKHGLDVNLVSVPVGSNFPAILTAGTLQIAEPSPTTLLQAHEVGIDLVAVAGVVLNDTKAGIGLVVAPGSPLHSAQDFKGKRIGVPAINAVTHIDLQWWLMKHGVALRDVTFVEVPVTQQNDMLRTGSVDAIVTFEPFLTRMVSTKAADLVASISAEMPPNNMPVLYATTRAWAEANRDTVHAFQAALEEAAAIAMADFKNVRPELAKYLKLPDSVLDILTMPPLAPKIEPEQISWYIDVMNDQGLLHSRPDPRDLVFH
jgi:NitT/TauT family transport system substrate-binding protein